VPHRVVLKAPLRSRDVVPEKAPTAVRPSRELSGNGQPPRPSSAIIVRTMPRHDMAFLDDEQAQQKFEDHGGLLNADSLDEYATLADSFMGCPLGNLPGVEECQRQTGEWVRYNVAARLIGFMSEDRRTIFSYYVMEPHRLGGRTFRQYCEAQCRARPHV
jgi:hypothetical protein